MGVYIKGLDMPKGCGNCPFDNGEFCMAYPLSESMGYDIAAGKPEWCPLVEVKAPHDDLIDRDALIEGRVSNDNVRICAEIAPTVLKRREKTMDEHSETIRILHYGDADYPEVMQYVPEICDIVRVGNLDCVPLYQVIDRLREPKCHYWHRDEETKEIHRDCEG